MILRRKWPCAVCGEDVYYDAERSRILCRCEEVVNINLSKSRILLNFWHSPNTPVERNR
jgi:hypothetical protein